MSGAARRGSVFQAGARNGAAVMDVVEWVIVGGGAYIALRALYELIWPKPVKTDESSENTQSTFSRVIDFMMYFLVGCAMVALGVLSAKGIIVVDWGKGRETLFW